MADEDDFIGFDDGAYDWLYVEDDYPLTDELAETQIPSPGYAGTNFEIELDHIDFDWIGYWEELEYVDDEYWDNAQIGALAQSPSAKRKRGPAEARPESHEVKRRRMITMRDYESVKYVSLAKRLDSYQKRPPLLRKGNKFALLPDWRVKFANDTDALVTTAMPEDMRKAAEAQGDDTPPKKHPVDTVDGDADGDEDEWMDEDEDGEDVAEDGDLSAQLASLDPETLKTVLKQRLGDVGLGDMDEGAFMDTINKMLSGDGEPGDATGDLASALLGQATQGNDSAISGWLSQQGVSLDTAEEGDDDASSVATAEMPTTSRKNPTSNNQISPPDSAVEITKQNGETKQMAVHGSSPSTSTKKRAAPADEQVESTKKRKKVVFDVPSSQPAEPIDDQTEPEAAQAVPTDPEDGAPTSEDPLMSETTVHSNPSEDYSSGPKAKARDSKTAKNNTTTKANNYAKPTAAASAKQTRKRKADEEIEKPESKPKKQPKRAAKSETQAPEVEPAGRRTRSARARGGK